MDPCGVYSVSSFLLGIGVRHLWHFSAFVVYMRDAGWSFYFIYLFIYFLRGVACSVYGALGWDPCGVYSVSRVYWALGLDVCGAFQAFGRVIFVAFRVFVAFMGH